MSENTKARAMRWSGLAGLLITAGMVAALVAGQPPGVVVTAGIVLSVFMTLALRPATTARSADVPHDRVQVAVQAAMLEVLLADGTLDDDEAKRAVDVYRELTSIDIPLEAIHLQADVARGGGDDLRGMLDSLAGELAEDERATVLKAAVMIAVGDGELAAAERPAVGAVARTLGMGPDDVRAVVATLARGGP